MSIVRLHAACALLLSAPAAALAQGAVQVSDRPMVVPQHDVDVSYAVAAPSASDDATPLVQRMRFSVAGERQRVDPPGNGTYMITEYGTGRMIVVQPAQRLATVLPAPGGPIALHGPPSTGDYRRLGPELVAGTACTDWATRDVAGRDSVVCLTADGVLLRATQAGRVLVQAVRVEEVPQPADIFAIPDGDRVQTPPPAAAPPGPNRSPAR